MNISDTGSLMCLPIEALSVNDETLAHEYLVDAAAKLLGPTERNWLPLIVVETTPDEYEVIGNLFVYAVAQEAGLEEVWCVIADDSPANRQSAQALSQDSVPKTNLSTASRDEIAMALDFLLGQPKTPLKGISVTVATNRIESAPRRYWNSLDPITKLGCKIGKGAKLKALEQIFYLTPETLPDVITDPELLKSFTGKELKKIAKQRGLKGYSSLSKPKLITALMA